MRSRKGKSLISQKLQLTCAFAHLLFRWMFGISGLSLWQPIIESQGLSLHLYGVLTSLCTLVHRLLFVGSVDHGVRVDHGHKLRHVWVKVVSRAGRIRQWRHYWVGWEWPVQEWGQRSQGRHVQQLRTQRVHGQGVMSRDHQRITHCIWYRPFGWIMNCSDLKQYNNNITSDLYIKNCSTQTSL